MDEVRDFQIASTLNEDEARRFEKQQERLNYRSKSEFVRQLVMRGIERLEAAESEGRIPSLLNDEVAASVSS